MLRAAAIFNSSDQCVSLGVREFIFGFLRFLLYPVAAALPLGRWPYVLGRVFGIKLHNRVRANPKPTTYGSANINIVIALLGRTLPLPGDVAECGVFRGATLASIAYFCRQQRSGKTVFGFDSFSGFDESELKAELKNAAADKKREAAAFASNSAEHVKRKLRLVGAYKNVVLHKGFFADTLHNVQDRKFCFVHLDCDLAAAYETCLGFFYERMTKGGIMLFDEYRDPVYEAATAVIDRFFEGRPEKVMLAESDNYMKYYIVKQ